MPPAFASSDDGDVVGVLTWTHHKELDLFEVTLGYVEPSSRKRGVFREMFADLMQAGEGGAGRHRPHPDPPRQHRGRRRLGEALRQADRGDLRTCRGLTPMGTNFWGVLIRGLREEQGVSQRTLSALTGVNRSTLRKIEAGETVGDIAIMESLLDFLGYELEAIVKGVAVENRSRVAASRILSIDLLSGFDLVKKPTLEK